MHSKQMGGCVSVSSQSTCSSRSNGENTTSSSMWLGILHGKRSRKTSSANVSTLQHQASVPKRIFTNGCSHSSCIFTQQGRKGINQDAMIVWEDFIAEGVTFCGVFDGHGPHGHLVARQVRDALPLKVSTILSSIESKKNGSSANCCKGNGKFDAADSEEGTVDERRVDLIWREAFLKAFKAMDKELRSHPNLDCFCSGCTAVSVVKQGSNLFMGYIGDSRAVLGSKDKNDAIVAIQLTVDLKPDLPREAERIKRCKGRVFALQDEPEVQRVWLPFDNAPGLAMARAFGDFCLKEYGVISIPEFSHVILTDADKFVVLASDGVWDVLSNEEVVRIVYSAPTRSTAAKTVVDSAAREWRAKYPTSRMDDCAVVCLFLDGKMGPTSDHEGQGFSSTFQSSHSGHSVESDDGPISEPHLQRNFTIRSHDDKNQQNDVRVSAEEHINAGNDDQSWSGLEGVTRVNSIVQLPRFSEEKARS